MAYVVLQLQPFPVHVNPILVEENSTAGSKSIVFTISSLSRQMSTTVKGEFFAENLTSCFDERGK